MTVAHRLTEAIGAVCPIFGVSIAGETVTPAYNGASSEQITAAEAVIASFDWSTEAHDAWTLSKARHAAKSEYAGHRVLRALASMLLDELNSHSAKITAILDAVDGASSLATLKTAVAAITDPPQRTINQIVTVLENKIDADA